MCTYPAGSSQDVGVIGVVVALAGHLHPAEAIGCVHVRRALPLHVVAVEANVAALHHTGVVTMATSRAAYTLQLHGGKKIYNSE